MRYLRPRLEAFVVEAIDHPLPPYNFDSDGNPHPWIARLYETNGEICEMLAEQVRPALSKLDAPVIDAQLRDRYRALVYLSQAIDSSTNREDHSTTGR
jgi:hypothetical protein